MASLKNIGWLYCFSNETMPGIYKIGMTTRTPAIRLKEANATGTYSVPVFKIVLAKKVNDVAKKEKEIHQMLTNSGRRVYPRREFFRAELDEIMEIFDSVDGEYAKSESSEAYTGASNLSNSSTESKKVITNVIQDMKNETISIIEANKYANQASRPRFVKRADSLASKCNDRDMVRHYITNLQHE